MGRVKQRRVLGSSRLDVLPRGLGPAQFEGDRDDLKALWMELAPQCLPPGQVEGAASVGRPRDDDDLLPTQRRQTERGPGQIVEDKLGCVRADQSAVTQ